MTIAAIREALDVHQHAEGSRNEIDDGHANLQPEGALREKFGIVDHVQQPSFGRQSAMTLVQLYPPLASATVVGFLWLMVAFKFHKQELARGDVSFTQCLWLLTMPGALAWFMFSGGFARPLVTWFDLFMGGLAGLGMGACGVFAIKMALFDKVETRTERIMGFVYLLVFGALLTSGAFIGS